MSTDSIAITVKWGKESLVISFVLASGVRGLKAELEEKTGVPAERMKLMAKSKGVSTTIHSLEHAHCSMFP